MDKVYNLNFTAFLLLVLLNVSCSYKADKTDIFKVGEAINEAFVRKDPNILKQIFIYQLDSLTDSQREEHERIQDIFNKDTRLIKIDTTQFWWMTQVNLYYENNDVFYKVSGFYTMDLLNNYIIKGLYLTNINEECEKYNNEPYSPSTQITFRSIIWKTDNSMTFKNGKVRLQNNTDSDIHYIKFRVVLKKGESAWNAETFFNQTVESYIPIYQGDIETIDIPGLENYYAGFIIKPEILKYDVTLIEIRPKPESDWCQKIKEFQNGKYVNIRKTHQTDFYNDHRKKDNPKIDQENMQHNQKPRDVEKSETLNFLSDFNGKYPHDIQLLENSVLKKRMKQLIGNRYEFLKSIWEIETPIEIKDGVFFSWAMQAHSGGDPSATIVVDLNFDELFVGIRENENVKIYSENGSKNPKCLDDWSKEN